MTKYTDIESIIDDGILQDALTPNCVKMMQQELVEYNAGESLTCAYPVLEIYSNPRKSMQGGIIAAAFDNTFGYLVYLLTNNIEMATIDAFVSYHKPIYENDRLIVTAFVKSRGKTLINLAGEAYDKENNLIATASSNFITFLKK